MDLTFLEAIEIATQETKEYIDEQPVISYGETQFLNAASRMTAKNNVGVFVGSDEPANALDGDIWIDPNDIVNDEPSEEPVVEFVDNMFISEYGVTTYEDYLAAYTAGKVCHVLKDGVIYSGNVIKSDAGIDCYYMDSEWQNTKFIRCAVNNMWSVECDSSSVFVTVTTNDNEVYSIDKTFMEIKNAIELNKNMTAIWQFSASKRYVMKLHSYNDYSIVFYVHLDNNIPYDTSNTFAYITLQVDDTVTVNSYNYKHLPDVTTDNDGAFLRVVDGAWTPVDILDAGGVWY